MPFLLKQESDINYNNANNKFIIKEIDEDDENDDVFDHKSIISYFK
jgi:hypothetical protein